MMQTTGSFGMTQDFLRGIAMVIGLYVILGLTTVLWLAI